MLPEQLVGDCANLHHGWGGAFEGFDFVGEAADVCMVGPLGFTLPYFLTFSSLSPSFSRYEADSCESKYTSQPMSVNVLVTHLPPHIPGSDLDRSI